ncbi:MAG: hypothetical protein ABEJ65_06235 [bacterium]
MVEDSRCSLGGQYFDSGSRSPFLKRGQEIRFLADGEKKEGIIVEVQKDMQRELVYTVQDDDNNFYTVDRPDVVAVKDSASGSWGSY